VGIYRGNVNSDVFLDFVHDHLAPNDSPFNGINLRSIVVMGKFIAPEKNAYRINQTRWLLFLDTFYIEYFIIAATRRNKWPMNAEGADS